MLSEKQIVFGADELFLTFDPCKFSPSTRGSFVCVCVYLDVDDLCCHFMLLSNLLFMIIFLNIFALFLHF